MPLLALRARASALIFEEQSFFSYISLAQKKKQYALACAWMLRKKKIFSRRWRIDLRRIKLFSYISLAQKNNNMHWLALRF